MYPDITELTHQLGTLLPDWRVNDDGTMLHHTTLPYGIYLRCHAGRIVITGIYPSGYAPHDCPEITVSPTRAPAAIAAEIGRRFLPAYLAAAATAWRDKEKWEAQLHQRDQQIQALAAILDAPARSYGGDPWVDWHCAPEARASVTAHGGTTFTWKLQIPFELACQLGAVLRAWRAGFGGTP